MDAPVAPDLDEIIGGSDEENDVEAELLTPAELLQRLLKLWQNEKVAPELLSAHPDLLDLVQQEVNRLEIEAKLLPPGDLRSQIKRMQVERIRYLLTDYMRLRIGKIEQFTVRILSEERLRPEGDAPHLTAEEFLFAKAYTASIKEYLKNVIVSRLPANMQLLLDENMDSIPGVPISCETLPLVMTSLSSFKMLENEDHVYHTGAWRTASAPIQLHSFAR